MQPPTPPPQRNPLTAVLLAFLRGVLTVLIVIDEIARPLYRPLIRWLSSLRVVARIEAAIAPLPRLAILILLAIPFAIAEPLKLLGLLLMGQGRIKIGLVVLGCAHLASFLIVERIYHAGRDKLLSYGWLAGMMTLLVTLRTQALDWIRASAAYRIAIALRDDVRRWWRSHLHRS
jgi:hypothetical protein